MFTARTRLRTALAPFVEGLALTTLLVTFALAAARAPVAHASSGGGSGPVTCKICPILPSPTLSPLTLTSKNNAVLIKGHGFSTGGRVDLYFWQNASYSSILDGGTFAGTVQTKADGSALNIRLPVTYKRPGGICLVTAATYVLAVDDKTQLSTGVQALATCRVLPALNLAPVTAHPSLRAVLSATKGTIRVSGRRYTPDTSVTVYVLQNQVPLPTLAPATLKAKGPQFATTLSTGYMGCSDTLSWTTFALDQSANAASPLRTVQHVCHPFVG